MWTACIFSICSLCILLCTGAGKVVPCNYIMLFVFTLCEGYMVSACVAKYNKNHVFASALMTLAVTVGLTIYACTTKRDFTMCGGICWIFVFGLIGVGLAGLCTNNTTLNLFYMYFGIVVYGFYIIYDTQLIIGTKKFRYNNDDYIIAAA